MAKPQVPQLTPEQEFLVRLEMERNDRSYLGAPKTPEVRVIVREKKVYPASRVERDKMMFHAGRYAEGARDNQARQAARKLDKELADEDR